MANRLTRYRCPCGCKKWYDGHRVFIQHLLKAARLLAVVVKRCKCPYCRLLFLNAAERDLHMRVKHREQLRAAWRKQWREYKDKKNGRESN